MSGAVKTDVGTYLAVDESPKALYQALDTAYTELQYHAEGCSFPEHLGEVENALRTIGKMLYELEGLL